ncbi:hypothetical protein T310_6576 [Rasamsonia emersonii CBS 393.64]|uniref:Uncharacterized protein n=1 Tax=Rasamsonia emersonii (strain ATCC 16479 / CBS 393.64 / IMI 116815) TaxID=1408163 RepID=A0A0F4YMV0_RASE3|nr:hypothetical protein T310_6576 [Rasamsonia emersonii CBS 393.64]KKA19430.1 hypothetical protein T310_6576 [Rasamsonia emersonii CBS 393.64]
MAPSGPPTGRSSDQRSHPRLELRKSTSNCGLFHCAEPQYSAFDTALEHGHEMDIPQAIDVQVLTTRQKVIPTTVTNGQVPALAILYRGYEWA